VVLMAKFYPDKKEKKEILGNWTAKAEPLIDENDLTNFVGMYNSPLDVRITRPFKIKRLKE
jgi:hypothetical protein